METLGRGMAFGILAALPLAGLIVFFETTRPAQVHGIGITTAEPPAAGSADSAFFHTQRSAVARLKGVSAELRPSSLPEPCAKIFSASDAARAFAGAPYASLKAGFKTEFVTKEHRRLALRIVSRQAIVDQAVPDNERLVDLVPASTANLVTFVWGPWLYRVEVEDKGPEPEVVVQKIS